MPDPTPETPNAKIVSRLGPAGIFAVVYTVLPLLGLIVLGWNLKHIEVFLTGHQDLGIFVYIGAFTLLAGFALLPTWPQSLIGGWAFGMLFGTPAAVVSVTLASMIGTELVRRASSSRVEQLIQEKPKWRAVRDALVGGSFLKTTAMVALIRLPPNSPFAICNLVFGATRVNRAANLLGTLVGIIPRTTITVYIGQGIQKLSEETLETRPPTWVFISGFILMMIVIGVIGRIAQRALERIAAAPAPRSTT
jgi:uncharacterized membrane protein YdjX (TVP38/TMEM64 family)